ncbi:MAG: N-acetyl-gamma-glutamyl-phosphate reductase, partial [Oscillospiraceae bacterium]
GKFDDKELHEKSVYGLCEFNRENIKNTNIIANPGCFPTSISLALMPALKNGLVATENIIIDSKSGASGAGKSLSDGTHFVTLNEGFHSYKTGNHRHTPEIEETLSEMAGEDIRVTFVPHLLPINRGILSTIYVKKNDKSLEEIHKIYKDFYKNEYFVKVLDLGKFADVKNVRLSNFCHISLHEDSHTGNLIITSAIDNMVKGAAGQAVQNMNIVFGFDEKEGLALSAPAI